MLPVFYSVLVLLLLTGAEAVEEGCYTSGSVAGIVIATIVVTLVMGGLASAFIWYLWNQRKGAFEDAKVPQKPIICPPMSPDKQLGLNKENNDYAFDNPYFKDDEKSPDSAEKGESGFHLDNGDIIQQNTKASNGEPKKGRAFSSLPFHAVFHPSSGKKQKTTTDDTYISKHLERLTVPLRGHDFTGLGFNICGNMRDGIFVKDVLHRGPASESGKIKAGDKILGVTVSFSGMVYEDALTILSYASPYDVRLEIEKSTTPHLPSPKRLGTSTSFRTGGQRGLFHPIYRSQSIDDLTQIGKDNLLSGNSPGTQKTPKETSATPKRSQSVETNCSTIKARNLYSAKTSDEPARNTNTSNKGSRTSSISSSGSTGQVVLSTTPNGNTQPVQSGEEAPCTKKEVKSSRFRVEQISVKTEAPVLPPIKPVRDPPEEKQTVDCIVTNEKTADLPPKPAEEQLDVTNDKVAEVNKPTAPPRTPKRKAPAPPPITSAVIHRADEQQFAEKETEVTIKPEEKETIPPPPPTSELPDFGSIDTSELNLESSNNSSAVSVSHVSHQTEAKEEPSSPGKRKASSLGDLTKLDQDANHKTSTSSAILERAVSLDLQQSIPGENLVKQKKVLKAPSFDSDCDEHREDTEVAGLKRWEDQFLGLANGHLKHKDELSDSVDEVDGGNTLTSVIENKAVTKKLITVDIDLDSSNSETTLQETLDSEKLLTSTPIRKGVEVKNFLKNDKETEQVLPVEENVNGELSTMTSSVFSPMTISIPIIKPDMTNFEKLTPPVLDSSWRLPKASDEANKVGLERISVQSLYKPIFSSKELPADETTQTLVNGDEDSPKTPNNAAGFAKTLIIPGPDEVENLLSLAIEPNTPPPHLDSPPKPAE